VLLLKEKPNGASDGELSEQVQSDEAIIAIRVIERIFKPMQRIAFLIRVKPEKIDEYRRLHNPIWPELAAELTASGIGNYSLWLRPDGTEFGYLECHDWAATCAYLAKSEVHARWQEMMKGFLLTGADAALGGQPVEMLEQAFVLD
jgi:L-rhamnose mutarotase